MLASSPVDYLADRAFLRLEEYSRRADYAGYEFDDLLGSAFVRGLCFDRLLPQRIAVQVGELFPLNIRPLVGVRKLQSTKARGFFAKGYLYYYQCTGGQTWLNLALQCLDWLVDNASRQYHGLGWANHFDFASRGGYFPAGLPTIVWTSHIAQVFEHAYSLTGQHDYLDVLRQAGEFVLHSLERHEDEAGICFAYAPGHINLVHNANLLGAATLMRCWKHFGDEDCCEAATLAYRWTIRHINPDGSWHYGVGDRYGWIDSFHTAYTLDCLIAGHELAGEQVVPQSVIDRTYDFWVRHFFLPDGTPRYYHDRTLPLDIQCAAQAIETLSKWSERFEGSLELAKKVVRLTVAKMQKSNGAFRYEIRRLWKNNLESIHWGQATMLSALGAYLYHSGLAQSGSSEESAPSVLGPE